MNNNEIWTLLRYAGQELTQKIRDVAVKELTTNKCLEVEERKDLESVVEQADNWLVK